MSKLESKCSLQHGLKKDDILYYLHIPKTGGTTLISLIDSYYNRKNEVLGIHAWKFLIPKLPLDFSNYRFVRGHYGIGFYRLLPKKPINITILREPTDLIISIYKMLQRQRAEAERYSIPQDKTISELITDPNILDIKDTLTRWLGVDQDVLSLTKGMDLNQIADFQPEEHETFLSPDMSDDELLKVAKQRLSEFAWVGILERFEESVFLLHYQFGSKPIRNVVKKNVAPSDEKGDLITNEAMKKIEEWTKLDRELYKYGLELFESRYLKMVSDLKEKYDEPSYKKMEQNDVVFDMLEKNYKDKYDNSPRPSFTDKIRRILAS